MVHAPDKKYLIIHMGGTIGMVETSNGLAPPKNSAQYEKAISQTIRKFQKGHRGAAFDFVSLSVVDSNNINPEALEELVAFIRAMENKYDGFLITHGTDTAATTAAALNLCFFGEAGDPVLSTPVVITAAQRPIGQAPTDSETNLLHSLNTLRALSAETYYPIVVFVFAHKIINGAHVLKVTESGYNAFSAVSPEGVIGDIYASGDSVVWNNNFPKGCGISCSARGRRLTLMNEQGLSRGKLMLSPLDQTGAGVEGGGYIHLTTGSTFSNPRSYICQTQDPQCLGLIFVMAGIGNTGEKNFSVIRNAVVKYGIPICGVLGIPGGTANMTEYEAGSQAYEAGIVAGITTSVPFAEVHLAWAIANQRSINGNLAMQQLKLMQEPFDLCGIFKGRAEGANIPPVYFGNDDALNCYRGRVIAATELLDAYRYMKGPRFRRLSVPEELAEDAGKYLPRPSGNFEREGVEKKHLSIPNLTGWSPPSR